MRVTWTSFLPSLLLSPHYPPSLYLGDGDGGADVESLAQVRSKGLLQERGEERGSVKMKSKEKRAPISRSLPPFHPPSLHTCVTWPKGSMATILWCAHLGREHGGRREGGREGGREGR